jgi:pimeloyl-ACP methyl ester carboxylesterase
MTDTVGETSQPIADPAYAMTRRSHITVSDLRGLQRMTNDAVVGLADLVETMHHTIGRAPGILGPSPKGRTRGVAGLVYQSVRGVTRVVGGGIDALLGMLAPLIAERPSSLEREAVVAALNGVFGDYLVTTGNPLAIAMRLRANGTPLALTPAALRVAFPQQSRKVVVLVHGLCMNDLQWARKSHDHGAALARDLGYAPVYLHYNTGEHVSTNGRQFSTLMDTLVRAWPYPIERLSIIGHSMGGLVARSACHHAAQVGHDWLQRLDDLVFLGTPHFGAPLARTGVWADFVLGISPYAAPFARLGKVRSAGIKDLQHGYLRDEDWQARRRSQARAADRAVPLPRGVASYAVAASKQECPRKAGGRIRGDGLVPVDSALGRHADASPSLALPDTHRRVGYAMGHFDLLSRRVVYEQVKGWLAAGTRPSK